MTETKPKQLSLLSYREIAIPQQQIANELDSSLQKLITAEVNKYSTKMTEATVDFCNSRISYWKNHMEAVEQKLRNAESLVICHRNANDSLQKQLANCATTIENQRKNVLEQENLLNNNLLRLDQLYPIFRQTKDIG